MSTSSCTRDHGRFDEMAEEFAKRYRRGERPRSEESIDRLPGLAEEIREMFPALVEVEQVEVDACGDALQPSPPAVPRLGELGDYRIVHRISRNPTPALEAIDSGDAMSVHSVGTKALSLYAATGRRVSRRRWRGLAFRP